MVTAAHAQELPISPVTEPSVPLSTTPVAPVPQSVAPPKAAISTPGLDLQFRDIPVKQLLSTLAEQFNINLAVNAEVDGVISSINLVNRTPDEALQDVIAAAGNLTVSRTNSGTYIVNKKQPGAIDMMVAANSFNPGGFSQAPIMQNGIMSQNGMGNSPFNSGNLGNALPAIGQGSTGNSMFNDLPALTSVNSNGNRDVNQLRSIKIKNVPSAFVAYQLDPAHNSMPTQLQLSEDNKRRYGDQPVGVAALDGSNLSGSLGIDNFNQNSQNVAPYTNPYLRNSSSGLISPEVRANSQFGGNNNNNGGNRNGGNGGNRNGGNGGNRNGGGGGNSAGGSFDLPGDIQQIVSVDPQNVLLVAGGSDEDIRRLNELIDVLDQPLRQVEIEAQFVELQSQDARSFGIDFSTSRGNFDASTNGFSPGAVPGSISVGFVRGNFQAQLTALMAKNRAKLINAPRVTAINNLTASLQSTERRPVILTSAVAGGGINGAVGQGQNLLFISTTTGLNVTPTINGDDTITVLMQPQVSSQAPAIDATTNGIGTITQRQLETVANVRDGDTIALGGLKTISNQSQDRKVPLLGDIPFIGGLFRSKTITENESELIIFLTARIIRRAGDDVNVPGT